MSGTPREGDFCCLRSDTIHENQCLEWGMVDFDLCRFVVVTRMCMCVCVLLLLLLLLLCAVGCAHRKKSWRDVSRETPSFTNRSQLQNQFLGLNTLDPKSWMVPGSPSRGQKHCQKTLNTLHFRGQNPSLVIHNREKA